MSSTVPHSPSHLLAILLLFQVNQQKKSLYILTWLMSDASVSGDLNPSSLQCCVRDVAACYVHVQWSLELPGEDINPSLSLTQAGIWIFLGADMFWKKRQEEFTGFLYYFKVRLWKVKIKPTTKYLAKTKPKRNKMQQLPPPPATKKQKKKGPKRTSSTKPNMCTDNAYKIFLSAESESRI